MATRKTILITGTRGGIGLETALQLAANGHAVIATVHHEKDIPTVAAAAKQRGVTLAVEKLNILNEKDRELALRREIDVLINNAAIGESGPLIEMPMDRLRRIFETNVFTTIELSQQFARAMVKRGAGSIIFIGSLAGRLSMPYMGAYSMTKFSLKAAVDALRFELRPLGIHTSVIEPGAYATGFNEKMHAKKYEWLNEDSIYHAQLDYLRRLEKVNIRLQNRHLDRIARQVVRAAEARRPRARYTAPWWQAAGVQLLRIIGR